MASIVGVFETGDYETWKRMFDSDPVGRRQAAQGHRVMRSVDNPNEVFVRVDFDSVDEAKTFRERLLASNALDAEVSSDPDLRRLFQTPRMTTMEPDRPRPDDGDDDDGDGDDDGGDDGGDKPS